MLKLENSIRGLSFSRVAFDMTIQVRKLNEHSKELQAKQEEIAKKHNLLSAQYEELGHLKVNMNEYLGRTKTVEKKESVIGKIKKCKVEEKLKPMVKKEASKEAER